MRSAGRLPRHSSNRQPVSNINWMCVPNGTCLDCWNLFAGTRDLGRELSHRLSLPGHFREDLRPAHLVKSRCRSELLEWNSLQRVDAVEQKDADSRNIGRNLRDTLQKLEPAPFTTRRDLPRDERARDTQGEPCLGDPGIVALLGQQMQV